LGRGFGIRAAGLAAGVRDFDAARTAFAAGFRSLAFSATSGAGI
jgi:hypothetical protein